MQRMNSLRGLGLVSAVVVVAAAAGCEPECVADFDCGIGNSCEAGACITGGNRPPPPPGPPPGEGEGEGEGETGEGEGELDIVDDLDAPASMLQATDGFPGGSPELVLVGQYDPAASIDLIETFNVVTGEFVDNVIFEEDTLQIQQTGLGTTGQCNIDTITFEAGVDPAGEDELWWTCAILGVGLQQSLVDDLVQTVTPAGAVGADLIVRLLQEDDVDPNIAQRRVFARRGTGQLVVEQIAKAGISDRPLPRDRDVVGVQFSEIAGLSLVAETDNATHGDIVLVFDRAYPEAQGRPALVPIERQNTGGGDSDVWALAPELFWRVLELPANTHAVRFLGGVTDPDQLTIGTAQQNTANLEVYLPVEGIVAFARLEIEMGKIGPFDPDGTDFTFQEFEQGASDRPSAVPSSEDRILIEPVPGDADSVFYITTNQAFGWKLKLHRDVNDDFTSEVERAQFFDESSDLPSAMVTIPGSDDAVWIALKNQNQLHPIEFDLGN